MTRLTWSRRGFVRDRCGVRGTVRWRGHRPAAALADVDKLSESLQGYHLFHATRRALLRDLHDYAEAAQANTVALALTKNTGELSSKSGRRMSIEEASRSSEKLTARSTRPGFGISAWEGQRNGEAEPTR